jgi:hypothetical protein
MNVGDVNVPLDTQASNAKRTITQCKSRLKSKQCVEADDR